MNITHFQRSVRVNIKNIVKSPNFSLAVLLCFCVLFAEIIKPMQTIFSTPFNKYGDAYFFNMSLHFGYFIYAAPLVCAFASGGLFYDDQETGFNKLRLMKSGRKAYQYSLWVGATLGGGFAVMSGILLFSVVCATVFGPQDPASILVAVDGWLPVLSHSMGNWAYMIAHALLGFLFGMVWSGIGLVFSVFVPNRYISYLSPFIICFSSVLVLPNNLRPLEMLVQMNWDAFTFPKLIGYQFILYIVALICYAVVFDRRVIHG